jgi:gentisate 1,2-dioxygenase
MSSGEVVPQHPAVPRATRHKRNHVAEIAKTITLAEAVARVIAVAPPMSGAQRASIASVFVSARTISQVTSLAGAATHRGASDV